MVYTIAAACAAIGAVSRQIAALKKIVAEQAMDIDTLKEIASKQGRPFRQATGGDSSCRHYEVRGCALIRRGTLKSLSKGVHRAPNQHQSGNLGSEFQLGRRLGVGASVGPAGSTSRRGFRNDIRVVRRCGRRRMSAPTWPPLPAIGGLRGPCGACASVFFLRRARSS